MVSFMRGKLALMDGKPDTDPLLRLRQELISKLRPAILHSLGISEEELTETPFTKKFPQEDGTTLELSAMRLGEMPVCSVTRHSAPFPMGSVVMSHSSKHEFIGDSDISKENRYKFFDEAGREINDERLEESMGAPMLYHSDDLGIFDDADFLTGTIPALRPEDGIESV